MLKHVVMYSMLLLMKWQRKFLGKGGNEYETLWKERNKITEGDEEV